MDDLLIFIRALLVEDAYLLALFQGAGASEVDVATPKLRTKAKYPRIILSGDDGGQRSYSDNIAKFFDGRVHIEIVCHESEGDPDPLDSLRRIQARIQDVLNGNRTQGLPGVCGQKLSAGYNCTKFDQVRPTGPLPTLDPMFERFGITYDTTVNRTDY